MRVICVHSAGGYKNLQIEERASKICGDDDVRIAVEAIGVNYADCVVRMGLYESAKRYEGWPITPGFEVCGRVVELGRCVNTHQIGDLVLAVTRFGGYTDELVIAQQYVFAAPAGWTAAQCATLPTVFMTAWYALCRLGNPMPDARVLIHSAAGGVGSALVQLCAIHGVEAIGVVGASHKVDSVQKNGAAGVIDKSSEPLWYRATFYASDGYDLIFDANGVSTLEQSYAALAPGGRLIVYGFHSMLPKGKGTPNWLKLGIDYLRTPRFDPLRLTAENRSVMGFNLSFLFHRTQILKFAMTQILAWAASGQIKPLPLNPFAFADVGAAHYALESAQTVGKVVLLT